MLFVAADNLIHVKNRKHVLSSTLWCRVGMTCLAELSSSNMNYMAFATGILVFWKSYTEYDSKFLGLADRRRNFFRRTIRDRDSYKKS
jgi:hypothetical protein